MAYTSGTAANYKDLLAVMATFAAANGWVILEQSATLVYMKGTGLAGLDEIYCGVETYEDPPNNRYNWNMVGSWGWRSGRAIGAQPASSSAYNVVACLWNAAIPYWMVATPRRILGFAKVGTTYQSFHLGLLNQVGTDAQYPYPLAIGGCNSSLAKTISDTNYSFWALYSGVAGCLRVSMPGGAWGSANEVSTHPNRPDISVDIINPARKVAMLTGLDGTYYLEPFYLRGDNSFFIILGAFDGLYWVTGYNNAAENIIVVDGVNYMVFPDGSRSGFGDYCALRLN